MNIERPCTTAKRREYALYMLASSSGLELGNLSPEDSRILARNRNDTSLISTMYIYIYIYISYKSEVFGLRPIDTSCSFVAEFDFDRAVASCCKVGVRSGETV